MRVIVLGAGVIGTTAAYYLARAGCEVTVIDRQRGPGLETSFANAGQISYGYAAPWAAPGLPLKAVKWLLTKHSPLSIRPDGTSWQLQWILLMLRNCTRRRYEFNKRRMVALAEYSRTCLNELRQSINIDYEGRQGGTLQLFRTQKQYEDSVQDIAVLKDYGLKYELLDASECVRSEKALDPVKHKFVGGLRLSSDETGDCHLFTTRLAEKAADLGVQFSFDSHIEGLDTDGRRVRNVIVNDIPLSADHYVLACGSYSRDLLRNIGIVIPVYPVKGYSITAPIVDADASPVSTVMDESYKVAITRFENRIRVGGMAEVAGFDRGLNVHRRQTLEMVLKDIFPDSADISAATFWSGLRPMTADGFPRIGRTQYSNLWLNTGHGTLGWTLACGSAQWLADLVTSKTPAISGSELVMASSGSSS